MELNLEAHVQPVFENPARQRGGIHLLGGGREEHIVDARRQRVLLAFHACPLVVLAVADDELHLIVSAQVSDVAVVVARRLRRARRLEVHDPRHAFVHVGNVERAAGLEGNAEPKVAQTPQKLCAGWLRQRLAAGDGDVLRALLLHPVDDGVQG